MGPSAGAAGQPAPFPPRQRRATQQHQQQREGGPAQDRCGGGAAPPPSLPQPRVMTSADGINWSSRLSAEDHTWDAIGAASARQRLVAARPAGVCARVSPARGSPGGSPGSGPAAHSVGRRDIRLLPLEDPGFSISVPKKRLWSPLSNGRSDCSLGGKTPHEVYTEADPCSSRPELTMSGAGTVQ